MGSEQLAVHKTPVLATVLFNGGDVLHLHAPQLTLLNQTVARVIPMNVAIT